MLRVVVSTFFILSVLSEALPPPPPPHNVHVDKWLLTWTPADTDEVTFIVEYSSVDSNKWRSVPDCVRIPSNSCDATAASAKAEPRCVRLRVRAERRGLKSSPVEACSQHSDSCTPKVRLTERPGSLDVPLNRKHDLADEFADAVRHRVYFRKEGTLQENFTENVSTVTIPDLEGGQRYCVRVQYVLYDDLIGPPSCPRCVLVPGPENSNQTALIASLVVVVVLVILVPLTAYVLMNHMETFKQWIPAPVIIPPHDDPPSVLYPPVDTSCAIEEPCDVVSVVPRDCGQQH